MSVKVRVHHDWVVMDNDQGEGVEFIVHPGNHYIVGFSSDGSAVYHEFGPVAPSQVREFATALLKLIDTENDL